MRQRHAAFAGYALTTDTSHELALWLYGPPGGGRSTFLAGLGAILGPRAGLLGLSEIQRNRFALADIPGKTLLTATEQPAGYLRTSHVLNALISGEPIQVEKKYRDPFVLVPRAKIAWAMNELSRVGSASDGLFRRVKVLHFEGIPEEKRDPAVKSAIEGEGAGILNWALAGLERLRERGRFEVPDAVKDATARWKETNDVPAIRELKDELRTLARDVKEGEVPPPVGTALNQIYNTLLRAMDQERRNCETGELESRLAALEERAALRRGMGMS